MAATPAPPDDGLLMRIGEAIGAAIFGAVVALVTFRTRLAKMDDRMKAIEKDAEEARRDDAVRWRTSERRQLFMLEVLSDIANKVGANERMSDLTIRLLHETNDHNEERR